MMKCICISSVLRHNNFFTFFRLWFYFISWFDEMLEYTGNKFSFLKMSFEGFPPSVVLPGGLILCHVIIGLMLILNTSFSSWQHGVTLEMFWRVRAKFLKPKAPIEMLCITGATWLTCFIICEYAFHSLAWFTFEACGERDYWFNCWKWRWW